MQSMARRKGRGNREHEERARTIRPKGARSCQGTAVSPESDAATQQSDAFYLHPGN